MLIISNVPYAYIVENKLILGSKKISEEESVINLENVNIYKDEDGYHVKGKRRYYTYTLWIRGPIIVDSLINKGWEPCKGTILSYEDEMKRVGWFRKVPTGKKIPYIMTEKGCAWFKSKELHPFCLTSMNLIIIGGSDLCEALGVNNA